VSLGRPLLITPLVIDKRYHIKLYRIQLAMRVIDTDCTGSRRSNYHLLQVVVHDQHEEMLMVNQGFVVPPASEAFVEISKKQVC
jgi:hypothetical protein